MINTNSIINQYSKLDIMHQLALMSGYESKVPTINQFIDDPYYLGSSLGDGIYPIWREAANIIYPTPYYSPKGELILSGAIGLGKSTFAKLVIMYDICRLQSLENPHKYYGLLESTIISYMLMNATKSLASVVLWSDIQQWIELSPYFKSKVNLNRSRNTFFQKNIDISTGSRGRDALGQATIGALFSEINDMVVIEDQGKNNLDVISKRRYSRFGSSGKEIIGHLILDSSNKGNRSFIDVRLEQKKKDNIDDAVVFSYSHWEAHAHHSKYSGETFQVYGGDSTRDPFILSDDNKDLIPSLEYNRIIPVPIEHLPEFRSNVIDSLRDLAGISTFSTFSFLSSNEIIQKVFDKANIVTKPIIILDFFDESQTIDKFIDLPLLKFLCNKPRFIHIDLGIKFDSTGLACSYLDGYTETTKYDSLSGKQVINKEPIFVTEFVMEIRAIPGQELAIYKIKDFILTAKKIGFPIHTVSTDGYQSTNLRQDLTLKGIKTELISVDRTKDPYLFLRNCMLEGRMHAPRIDKLIQEIKDLQELDNKFDHPSTSSKDLVDSVCGSVWSCGQNIINGGSNMEPTVMIESLTQLNRSHNKLEDYLNFAR